MDEVIAGLFPAQDHLSPRLILENSDENPLRILIEISSPRWQYNSYPFLRLKQKP